MADKLDIIFEDKNLLVVNKPSGLVVHEGTKTKITLVDLLARHLPASPLKHERYGLLHRLDKNTSGVLLVAKTKSTFNYLKNLFQKRQIEKEYLALVHGKLTPKKGIIRIPLARGLVQKTKFEPTETGKLAETKYEVIKYIGNYTYLKAYPKTGRTHQIRIHLASIGYPIVGDKVYGKKDVFDFQFLHAHRISFENSNGKEREFVAPLSVELRKILNQKSRIRNQGKAE